MTRFHSLPCSTFLMVLLLEFTCLDSFQQLLAVETISKNVANDVDLIRKSTHPVWCDAETGNITPVEASMKEIDVSDRHVSIASPVTPKNSKWWGTFGGSLSDFYSWLFGSWLTILVVFACLLGFTVVFLVWRYGLNGEEFARSRNITDRLEQDRKKAKIQDLPFEIEQTAIGLLGQAENLRNAGDYSKAIVYLFSHVLVELDGAGCIQLSRGKTNRTYLRELRGREKLTGFTNQLVKAFEFAFFGKHRLSQELFEAIWQQLPAFEENLKQSESNMQMDMFSKMAGGIQ